MRTPCCIALGAAALSLCGTGAARASGLEVTPVLVQLDAHTKSAVVALRNGGAEVTRYQLSVQSWAESPRGEMQLGPTRDVTFYPPLLELKPGEKRNLRVGAAVPFGALEKTYRLFVEELPPPQRSERAEVRVLTRVGIPIFLAPSAPAQAAVIDELRAHGGRASFKLRNTGTVRTRPLSIKLVALDEAGAQVAEKTWDGWYVLAQTAREYELPLPEGACGKIRKLEVRAQLERADAGLAASALVAPGTACPP